MNLIQLSAVCAAATLATSAFAGALTTVPTERAIRATGAERVLARENEPGDDRGRGGRRNDDRKPHKLGDDAPATTVAREGSEGPRGEGKGHPVSEDLPATLAREGSEGPRGEGKGHPVSEDLPATLAREGAEGPRGEGKGHPVADELPTPLALLHGERQA